MLALIKQHKWNPAHCRVPFLITNENHMTSILVHEPMLPVRPFKNFSEYAERNMFGKSKDKFKCLECSGCKRVRDYDSERCPVEGWSHVVRVTCRSCSGTGIGNKHSHMEHYRQIIKKYASDLEQYCEILKIHNSIREKLTEDEKLYLRIKFV